MEDAGATDRPAGHIGPRSTPNYAGLASQAIHHIGGGRTVFAGQRAEGFFVDLGSIFGTPAGGYQTMPGTPGGNDNAA